MDGYCDRCHVTIMNTLGEYCPRCPAKLYTRPVQFRTPTASQAPLVVMPLDHRYPTRQRQRSTPEIDRRYEIDAQSNHNIAYHEQRGPRRRNDLQRVALRATDTANHPPTESVNAEADHAFLVHNSPARIVNTPMQGSIQVLAHQPRPAFRDTRSRSPPRDRDLIRDRDRDLNLHDAGRYRTREDAAPVALQRLLYPPPSDSAWCLWCHCDGHTGYRDCSSRARRPELTVTSLNTPWEAQYLKPRPNNLRSPTNLVHIKDIAHELILHCNKFEIWVKQRDTFFTGIQQYLNPHRDCYEAWKSCMAAANTATNQYLLDMQEFAEALSSRLVDGPLRRLVLSEGLEHEREQRLLSDHVEMAKFLHSKTYEPEKISLDQTEYNNMVSELNIIRIRYARSSRKTTEIIQQVLRQNATFRRITKFEMSFTCLQAANPSLTDTARAYVHTDEPRLPVIADFHQLWATSDQGGRQ